MFWSQERELIEELRLRLRVAADFATLGAYELGVPDELDADDADHLVREQPPKRVLLFAKVAPVCPHSATTERACDGKPAKPARTSKGRHRGGAVRAPEQPCLCAGQPVRDL